MSVCLYGFDVCSTTFAHGSCVETTRIYEMLRRSCNMHGENTSDMNLLHHAPNTWRSTLFLKQQPPKPYRYLELALFYLSLFMLTNKLLKALTRGMLVRKNFSFLRRQTMDSLIIQKNLCRPSPAEISPTNVEFSHLSGLN